MAKRTKETNFQQLRQQLHSPAIYLLPNLFTALSLLAGVFAILRAGQGDFVAAGWAVVFAAFMDMLDGRVARLIDAQSDFGAQFDSLCDIVSFGVAPAIIAYEWGLDSMGRIGFATSFFFCATSAVRLARFNLHLGSSDPNYFVGLPTPIAGVTAATLVLVFGDDNSLGNSLLLTIVLLVLSVSMVSEIRYYSFKKLNVRARLSSPLLILLWLLIFSLFALMMLEFRAGGILVVASIYLLLGYWNFVLQVIKDFKEYKEVEKGNFFQFTKTQIQHLINRTDQEFEAISTDEDKPKS